MKIFKRMEEAILKKARSVMNSGNPTKEGVRLLKPPLLFSGPGYSSVSKQEVQKVLPALPAAPKGNNHGWNYDSGQG